MSGSSERSFPLTTKAYEIFEEIGGGVSSTVYRARCIASDEIVAIKILDLEKCRKDVETIRKEVRSMSSIDHPNLLRPHCSFLDGSSFWIVMPYMSGGSCFHILKSVYPEGIELPVIATLLREVLSALVYIHGQGHIHRDVKAGNILVDSKGTVKLGDFGASACMLDDVERDIFSKTLGWIAPEVMQNADGYDFKADIWSFGITALELAHGPDIFSKYPPMKVLLKTLENSPPCLDYEKGENFLKSFRELVGACLVKDPKNRPTASKLLKYPFFKNVHSTEYLSRNILDGLSPLGERYRKLKEKEAELLKSTDVNKEILSQRAYMGGISAWNFDLEDLRKKGLLKVVRIKLPEDELSISKLPDLSCSQEFTIDAPKGNPLVETVSEGISKNSEKDVMSISDNQTTKALSSPSFPSQILPSLGEPALIPSGADNPVCEEETLEPKLSSSNKQMEIAENDLDELQNNKALTSGIPASPNATEIIPLLQNLLLLNDSQKERLTGLVQLFDQTAENRDPIVNTEGGQISTEADLLCEIDFLKQSVEKLEEEVEKQKKLNAQLEDQINRLAESSDPA